MKRTRISVALVLVAIALSLLPSFTVASEQNLLVTTDTTGYQVLGTYRAPIEFGRPVTWLAEIRTPAGELSYVSYTTPAIELSSTTIEYEQNVSLSIERYTLTSPNPYQNLTVPLPYPDLPDDRILSDQPYERNSTHILFRIDRFDGNETIDLLTSYAARDSAQRRVVTTASGPLLITTASPVLLNATMNGTSIRAALAHRSTRSEVSLRFPYELPEAYEVYARTSTGVVRGERTTSTDLRFDVPEGRSGELVVPMPKNRTRIVERSEREVRLEDDRGNATLSFTSDVTNFSLVDPDTIPGQPARFTGDLYRFEAENLTNGRVDLVIDRELPPNPEIWKYDSSEDRWYRYPHIRVNATAIKVTIFDGGLGDDDGLVNGRIVDDIGLATSWYNDSWRYRQEITVNTSGIALGSDLSGYELKLSLTSANVPGNWSWNDEEPALRFTWANETSGSEQLTSHYTESYDNTSETATIWVRVPVLPSNTTDLGSGTGITTILMYYGNNASSDASNASATFTEYNDFSNGFDGLSQWDADGVPGTSFSVAGGNLTIDAGGTDTWTNADDYGSVFTTGVSGDFEATVRVLSQENSDPWAKAGVMVRNDMADDDNSLGYAFQAITPGNDYSFQYDTGSDGRLDGNAQAGSTTYPSYVRMRRAGNTYTGYYATSDPGIDGSMNTVGSYATGTANSAVDVGMSVTSHAGTTLSAVEFDDFIVRRYLSTPPSVSYGGETYRRAMNVTIDLPINGSDYDRNSPFTMNGTVECYRGTCPNATAYYEYYATITPLSSTTDTDTEDFDGTATNVTASGDRLSLSSTGSGPPWWDTQWPYRQNVTIENTNADLSNYTATINLTSGDVGAAFDWGTDRNAIRWVYYNSSADTTTRFEHTIISYDSGGETAQFDVMIPNLPNGNITLQMYYGNSGASDVSDNESAYLAYDDFEDGIDSSVWFETDSDTMGGTTFTTTSGALSITANGADTWTGSDAFGALWRDDIDGDVEIYTTVNTQQNTNGWAKSGIMIRDDLTAPGSSGGYAVLVTTPSNGYSFQWDSNDNGFLDQNTNGGSASLPESLRLIKSGTTISAYYDNVGTWVQVGSDWTSASINTVQDIGLYHTSHQSGTLGTATYEYFQVKRYAANPATATFGSEQTLTYESNGDYVSNAFDFGIADPQYDTISYSMSEPANTALTVETRSSADNSSYTPWFSESSGSPIQSPEQRYLQYRVAFETNDTGVSPVLDDITLSYRTVGEGWAQMASSGTLFTVPSSSVCGDLSGNCSVSRSVTPKSLGGYAVRVSANSTDPLVPKAYSLNRTVLVYSQPSFALFTITQDPAPRNTTQTLETLLLDDLGVPLSGRNVTFTDETGNGTPVVLGSAITDGAGYATLETLIPADFTLGSHTMNVSFTGNDTQFIRNASQTYAYDVTSTPLITNVTATPNAAGFGFDVNVTANVTDAAGLSSVTINITLNGTTTSHAMTPIGGSGYAYTYNETWTTGVRSYRIIAQNVDSITSTSGSNAFSVDVQASTNYRTENESYTSEQTVLLSDAGNDWAFPNMTYRREVTVDPSVTVSDYQLRIDLTNSNFNFSKARSDGADIRLTFLNGSNEVVIPHWFKEYNSTSETAEIWTNVPQLTSGSEATVYLYYGYASATDAQDPDDVFLYYTNASSLSGWTNSGASVNSGAGVPSPAFEATGGTYAYLDVNLTSNRVLEYDGFVISGGTDLQNMYFLVDSGGSGQMFRLESRAGNSPGFATTSNWGSWNAPSGNSPVASGTWHEVSIAIDDSIATGSVNALAFDTIAYSNNGGYIGIHGDAGIVTGGRYDNIRVRKYVSSEPSVSVGGELESVSGVRNTGSTDFYAYLRMITQYWTGSSWQNKIPPITDQQLVRVNASSTLSLSDIWNTAGGWDTAMEPGGTYRVYTVLEDIDRNVLTDTSGTPLVGSYNFSILEPALVVTNLTSENEETFGTDEYETGDTIDWINVTVVSYNNTAFDADVTLSVLDQALDPAIFGPQNETESCGDLSIGTPCERRFDNASSGYAIPLSASTGTYTFRWDVLVEASNADDLTNRTRTFKVYNIPNTASGTITTPRLYKPDSTTYDFEFTNLWSAALTDVNVTISCPSVTDLVCENATGGSTIHLGTVASSATPNATFTLSASNDTPSDNYDVNVTLEYVNPGGERRVWTGIGDDVLEVRLLGILAIEAYAYPSTVIRGSSANLSARMNNTGDVNATNAWLNYTLPAGWSVSVGSLDANFGNIAEFGIRWNNITTAIGSGASLGEQDIRLDSGSAEGKEDFTIYSVTVNAPTLLTITPNVSIVDRSETVRLTAELTYDNGTPIASENVSFTDETTGASLGSDFTDASGIAYVDYPINATATLGIHTIRANFTGNSFKYALATSNTTTIDVNDLPNVTLDSITPNATGYGQQIEINATATDATGVSNVTATITYPDTSSGEYNLTNVGGDAWSLVFNETWQRGTYTVSILATDSSGASTRTANSTFTIDSGLFVTLDTLSGSYGQNENVTLRSGAEWWNASWAYARTVNITNSGGALTNYQANVTIGTGDLVDSGYLQADCADVRFVEYDAATGVHTQLNHANTTSCGNTSGANTSYFVKIPSLPAASTTAITLYYGNPTAPNADDPDSTYDFYDDFEGTLDKWDVRDNDISISSGYVEIAGGSTGGDYGFAVLGSNETYTGFSDGILEGDVFLASSAIAEVGFRGDPGSNTGYKGRIDGRSGQGVSILDDPYSGWGTVSGCGASGTGISTGTWVAFTITASGTSLAIDADGESQSCTNGAVAGPGEIALMNHYGTYARYDNIRVRKYAATPPTSSVGAERALPSRINDPLDSSNAGYLIMSVERNESGTWQHVETIINDTATNTTRAINESGLDLTSIWNAWNTTNEQSGTYRVTASLIDPSGTVLTTDTAAINGSAIFELAGPAITLNVNDIRIYEVSDALPANRHSYSSQLVDSGTSTTFTLPVSELYRFEIEVENTGNTSWNLSSTTVNYSNLVGAWSLDASGDVWFSNETTLLNRRLDSTREGGSYDGTVTWNTSSFTANVAANETATFFFIVNTSSTTSRQITFTADALSPESDQSTLQVITVDNDPPVLYNLDYSLYNVTPIEIFRGQSFTAYARWNESISEANVTYQTTSPAATVTVQNTSAQQAQNWTNFTITTFSTWYRGEHNVTITAQDLSGNLNDTLPNRPVYVYGRSRIGTISLNDSSIGVGESVRISCRIVDNTASNAAIGGYTVSFTNGTDTLGTNSTGGSGYAYWDYTDNSAGDENVGCFIQDDLANYYKTGTPNSSTLTLSTTEPEPPQYATINGPGSSMKGEFVDLDVYWTDNFALDEAELSTNASGSYSNVTTQGLSGTGDWANFSYQIPTTMTPGPMGWRQWGLDTSSNSNVTPIQTITVYGWSEISSFDVSPGSISQGSSTTATCSVRDANSSAALAGYTVQFDWKNDTDPSYTSLGSNTTDGSGDASYTWTPSLTGIYDVRCSIADDPSTYYNVSVNESTDSLSVVSGADTQPPRLTAPSTYTINDTVVFRGQCALVTGEWDESINYSTLRYNRTSSTFETLVGTPPYTGNWTNISLCTNSSWTLGDYNVQLRARDQAGNLNDTLELKDLQVRGRSNVTYVSPSGTLNRTSHTVTCRVMDEDTGTPLNGYPVTFYDSDLGFSIGSDNTNSSGYASVNYDFSGLDVGPDQLSCTISNEGFYTAQSPTTASASVEWRGYLNTTVDGPSNGSVYLRGESVPFRSTTVDEFGGVPDDSSGNPASLTARWLNSTGVLITGEDPDWTVPNDYQLGQLNITLNVSEAYYEDGLAYLNIVIGGGVNVTSTAPTGVVGGTQDIVCRVIDSNVGNPVAGYDVNFSREGSPIGSAVTNATGYATVQDDTTSASDGSITYGCLIGDDAPNQLTAVDNSSNITVTVDNTEPSVDWTGTADTTGNYSRSWILVNATASDTHLDTVTLDWNGTNETLSVDGSGAYSVNKSGLSDGTYTARVYANDTAGNTNVTTLRTYTIDTTAPNLTIQSPTNVTYNQDSVDLNFTVSDANLDSCWYDLNGTGVAPLPGCSNTTLSSLADGFYELVVYANDTLGNTASASVNFTVQAGVDVLVSDIVFVPPSGAIEGQTIDVRVNVSNNGTTAAQNLLVELNVSLWNGTYVAQSSNTSVVNVSAGSWTLANFSWTADLGVYRFEAFVDSNDSFSESNETNNQVSENYSVSSYQVEYGLVNFSKFLSNSALDQYKDWTVDTPTGVIYYADADASYFPFNLEPLNGTNDLDEADSALGMTYFNDSISDRWDTNDNGAPDTLESFTISGAVIENVPVVASTSGSPFVTGLMWDSSDGGSEYNGSQDLVFVTRINASTLGTYGTYDYEISLPSRLKTLLSGTDLVERFTEIE